MDESKNFMKLSSEVSRIVSKRWESYQNACPRKLHPPEKGEYRIILPRDRRSLRALGIACWYLPDWLKWEIILQISEKPYSLDFPNRGLEISLELRCLVESKFKMLSYLSTLINPRRLFGTILQEDLSKALKNIRILRSQNGPVLKPIRRKGYKDKGTWRPPHRWKERYDFSLTEKQNLKEFKLRLFNILTLIFLSKLGEEGKISR